MAQKEKESMPVTKGIHHLGLAVKDLYKSTHFFTQVLGWNESGYDESYPRTAVSDGVIRLTLWQVENQREAVAFNRKSNIGLHHIALEVEDEIKLIELFEKIDGLANVDIEFPPELLGAGPRKHFMCNEPGGIRIEFICSGVE
jgi:catechol 2,3-dioxygenase-like lactoylglutathione lyase family enzyme